MRALAVAMASMIALTACQRQAPPGPPQTAAPVAAEPCPDGAPCPFIIALSLTPAAMKRLSGMHEKVEITAAYFGDIKTKDSARPMRTVDLGQESIEVTSTTVRVRLKGAAIDPKRYASPAVVITATSAHRISADDLLDCSQISETLSGIHQTVQTISCDASR